MRSVMEQLKHAKESPAERNNILSQVTLYIDWIQSLFYVDDWFHCPKPFSELSNQHGC